MEKTSFDLLCDKLNELYERINGMLLLFNLDYSRKEKNLE